MLRRMMKHHIKHCRDELFFYVPIQHRLTSFIYRASGRFYQRKCAVHTKDYSLGKNKRNTTPCAEFSTEAVP